MKILGIETSCDETASAVVEDGRSLLSNVVASQAEIHNQFGGVVPEVAARSHIEAMLPVVEQALSDAFSPSSVKRLASSVPDAKTMDEQRLTKDAWWDQIDGIAVTAGPGLLGSLLIGTLTAKVLADLKNKPLYAINHVEAHTYANFIVASSEKPESSQARSPLPAPPEFPLLALIVSGGHSQLVLFRDHLDWSLLGQTRDDAAGEAFDKVAKLLGLGFPGGPAIAGAAARGSQAAYKLPKAKLGGNSLDFSFSGLKTAVLRLAQDLAGGDHTTPSSNLHQKLTESQISDIAASFQQTVVDTLVDHTLTAFKTHQPQSVVMAGGVAANQLLRQELARRLPIEINYAPMNLCTDNAAMIAACAYHYANAGRSIKPTELAADSSLSM